MRREKRAIHNNKPKPEKEFVVTEPIQLMEFLQLKLSKESRNHVKSLLKYRAVSVNGVVRTKYDTPLHPGQKVRISRAAAPEETQKNTLHILYEDDDLIAVNKPAGLLSIATDKEKDITAYHLLTDYVKLKNPEDRIFAVHRLDRDTSGVFIVAKNEAMKFALQEDWAKLVSVRAYVAIVEGQLKEKSGTMRSWLKKTKTLLMYSSDRAGDGLEAITKYEVMKESEEYSWVDVHLETGRKNQIRVHMKDLGHPVVGDKKYGAKANPLKRLGLHAYQLEFKNPLSGEVMSFKAPIPQNFKTLFTQPLQNKE
ncbi:RluA family pseudouridine synthase [Scatolibacter rhodanostii]|uniref:RluA family pseudouridine synthase n=1 Tax=Scatolibacter rhodanostii TaxID=2014781 RepID=UPI001FA8BCB8|nr:RluA family pseudouridine synthase [Scatolibacter rhodanostii]